MIHRYARALSGVGIRRGKLVALFAPNTPDALVIRYGTHLLGAATVFLSAPAAPESRAELIADMDPDLLIAVVETAGLLPQGVKVRIVTVGIDLPQAALASIASPRRSRAPRLPAKLSRMTSP